ncbi:hypothetical protein GGH91_003504 [Coemansia sp. RSA 2671]|nr:hypothetical protein GGH91_003504 [Coemansia sp. RSA 2671]
MWTPERLADELSEIGINATAAAPSDPLDKLVRIVVPGGSATIRMRGGWSVDCSSVSTQWTVMDSLRRVLKCA